MEESPHSACGPLVALHFLLYGRWLSFRTCHPGKLCRDNPDVRNILLDAKETRCCWVAPVSCCFSRFRVAWQDIGVDWCHVTTLSFGISFSACLRKDLLGLCIILFYIQFHCKITSAVVLSSSGLRVVKDLGWVLAASRNVYHVPLPYRII